MKRTLIFVFAVLCAVNSFAFDVVSDNIYYNILADNTAEVTYGYQRYTGEVHVPQNIVSNNQAYRVTGIGIAAFKNSPGLTALYLPSSVEFIKSQAVSECPALNTVYLPSGIKKVALDAFHNTQHIDRIYTGCSFELKKYFYLTVSPKIEIIDGTTVIDSLTFAGSKLKEIIIPASVKTIGRKAFYNCRQLAEVKLPYGLTNIQSEAFAGCSSLSVISLPESVTSVGSKTFAGCRMLYKLEIPLSASSIGRNVIDSCLALTQLTAPVELLNNLQPVISTRILKNLETGGGLLNETGYQFLKNNIKSITQLDINKICDSSVADEFMTGAFQLITIQLPSEIQKTGIRAFAGCQSLQSLAFPSSITEIGKSSFENCRQLKTVTFSPRNNLKTVGDWTFFNCISLEKIQLPWGTKEIGEGVFNGCTALKSVVLPSSLTQIGANAFATCVSLRSITSEATKPPVVKETTFAGVDQNTIIFVPAKSINLYQTAPGWKDFKNIRAEE